MTANRLAEGEEDIWYLEEVMVEVEELMVEVVEEVEDVALEEEEEEVEEEVVVTPVVAEEEVEVEEEDEEEEDCFPSFLLLDFLFLVWMLSFFMVIGRLTLCSLK